MRVKDGSACGGALTGMHAMVLSHAMVLPQAALVQVTNVPGELS